MTNTTCPRCNSKLTRDWEEAASCLWCGYVEYKLPPMDKPVGIRDRGPTFNVGKAKGR